MRVPLTVSAVSPVLKPVQLTPTDVAFAFNYNITVTLRGTEVAAQVYSAEEGEFPVSQPLRTDPEGRIEGQGGESCWIEVGSYDLHIGEWTLPWEASKALPFPFVTPESFGAIGDGDLAGGGTDDYVAVQAAVDKLADMGGTLLLAKIYALSAAVVCTADNVVVSGPGTLDCTGMAAGAVASEQFAFIAEGSEGSPLTISADVAVGDTLVKCTTTGLAAGDTVLITSNENYIDGVSTTPAGNRGYQHRIDSVTGEGVVLTEGSRFAYDSGSSATIRKINQIKRFRWEGPDVAMAGLNADHSGIYVRYALAPKVEAATVTGCEDASIRADYWWGGEVANCQVNQTFQVDHLGYGVEVVEASRDVIVRGNHGEGGRHMITGGGSIVTCNVRVLNNVAHNTGRRAFDCHEETYDWVFEGNQAHGCNGLILIRGQNADAIGNKGYDLETVGVHVFSEDTNSSGLKVGRIERNEVYRCGGADILLEATPVCRVYGAVVTANTLEGGKLDNLEIIGAEEIEIGSNIYRDPVAGESGTVNNIRLVGTSELPCKKIKITGGTYEGAGSFALKADFVQGLTFRDATVAEKVWSIKSCTGVWIEDVWLEEATVPTMATNTEVTIQGGKTNLEYGIVSSVTEAGEAEFTGGPDDFYTLTGVTVKKIKAGRRGRTLTIRLSEAGSKIIDGENLKLAGNLEGSGRTLTLRQYDASNYMELARAVT